MTIAYVNILTINIVNKCGLLHATGKLLFRKGSKPTNRLEDDA